MACFSNIRIRRAGEGRAFMCVGGKIENYFRAIILIFASLFHVLIDGGGWFWSCNLARYHRRFEVASEWNFTIISICIQATKWQFHSASRSSLMARCIMHLNYICAYTTIKLIKFPPPQLFSFLSFSMLSEILFFFRKIIGSDSDRE